MSQVRTRLAAGGGRIRTLGPRKREIVLGTALLVLWHATRKRPAGRRSSAPVRLASRQQGFRLPPEAEHEITRGLGPRQCRGLACPGLHAHATCQPHRASLP